MLGNAMVEACPAEGDAPVPITPAGRPRSGQRSYPDRLDVGLLRTAGVCVLASVMAHVDVTVVSVAQRTFVADFGSTQAVVAWTMTGYMLALATVIPTAGWAADRFGTRRLFMGSVLAFTLGSLLCAVAPNILLLIIFRVVQGFGGGMLTPVSFAILAREAGPKRLGRVMAVVGIPMLLGPVGGPILGGWLIGAYGWRWIFLVNLPVGLSALVLAAIVFPRDRPAASENFDYMGLLLLSPGLATFLFGVSSSPARGTMADRHVLIPAITGLALIAAFVAHSWYRTEHPLIDMRLFQNRAVAQANMTMTVLSLGLFGSFLLLPSYLQQVLHQITDAIGGAYHPTGPRCHAGDADRRSDDGPTGTGQDRAGWDHADRCGVGHLRLWCRAASGLLTHSADRAGNHGHGHGLLHDATVRGGSADPGPTSDRSRFDADQRQPAGGRFDRDRTDVGAAHLPVQSQRNHRYCKESRTDPREWRRAGGGG